MHRRTLSLSMALSLVAACSSSPTGPSPNPTPAPEPRTETRYDVGVTLRYIDISRVEACDGRLPVVNVVNEGEFQYSIFGSRSGVIVERLESDGYYTLLGDTFPRGPNGRINFTNRTWSFDDLKTGSTVGIELRGTEWDTPIRDQYMDDRSGRTGWTMDSALTSRTGVEVPMGKDTCGMALVLDLAVARRQVVVPGGSTP